MTLGERIKARRVQLGWSQTQVAAMAHVHRDVITALEDGQRHTATSAELQGLARALGITLAQYEYMHEAA
jgi:transcriptional regulator with XRE-family HTH domain